MINNRIRCMCSCWLFLSVVSASLSAFQYQYHHRSFQTTSRAKSQSQITELKATTSTSSSSSTSSEHNGSITTDHDNNDNNDKMLKAIGVPDTIRHLQVGQYLKAFRRTMVAADDTVDTDDTDTTSTDNDTSPTSQSSPIIKQTNFTIERLSQTPNVFILRDFLSSYECDKIISYSSNNTTMTEAETITNDDTTSRKNCKVTWIPSGPQSSQSSQSSSSSPTSPPPPEVSFMVSNLVSSTANILLSKDVLSHPSAGVEDLQVLKYDIGGEFVLHHDGEPRVLTVIYYVNGVGGTWFPLAKTSSNSNNDNGNNNGNDNDNLNDPCNEIDEKKFEYDFQQSRKSADLMNGNGKGNDNDDDNDNDNAPKNKAQAVQLGHGFVPGEQGLLVKGRIKKNIAEGSTDDSTDDNTNDSTDNNNNDEENPNISWINKGDAIAFYNYQNDGSGNLDWRSLHTGLPTTEEDGVKWIANHWFRLGHLL